MKNHITNTALDMVHENGLINLSLRGLCERSDIPDGSFAHYMGESFTDFVARIKKVAVEDTTPHHVVKTRTNPELRREQILNVAVEMAIKQGYNNIRRKGIAETAGVSENLVSNYFSTMTKLKRDIIRVAIKREIPEIIAQGLANNDRHAKKAPKNLKNQAAHIIAKS